MLNICSIIMAKPDSKDYLLKKTFFLLLTKGYDDVSITDIQNETGMSRGILYHYYSNKEELFHAAAEVYLVGPFLIELEKTKGFGLMEMIGYVVEKYRQNLQEWRQHAGTGKISMANYDFLFYQMIRKNKKIEKTYYRMREEERVAWVTATQLSLSRNEIHSMLSAGQIAEHFILILDGAWMQFSEKGSVSQYIRLTNQALQNYYKLLKK